MFGLIFVDAGEVTRETTSSLLAQQANAHGDLHCLCGCCLLMLAFKGLRVINLA